MAAYLIGEMKWKDTTWIPEYLKIVPALIEKHGGRYVVQTGEIERLEGTREQTDGVVILEFPTKADYTDPFVVELIEEKGWIVWPPLRFRYDTNITDLDVPAPSPPSVPPACASNGRQWPSGDAMSPSR